MDSIDKKGIIEALKGNNQSSEWEDTCEMCGCVVSFDRIGFRGVCYECKPSKKITAKDIDDAVNALIERYGEFNVNLSGKQKRDKRSGSDS